MNLSRHAVAASVVFDGTALHADSAVVIEGARIIEIVPREKLPAAIPVRELPSGEWLTPGFIDIQVNGGGDVLFNDAPTDDAVAAIAAAHRRFGTTSLLPTLITDSDEKMRQAFGAVQTAMKEQPGILGIHFEGPFLSPEKAGVHDPKLMRAPTAWHRDLLTSFKSGVTLVTCAPERVPAGFIKTLVDANVRVSLGHSMATYEETRRAMAEGLTGFTHLFNAMRPLAAREGGPIAAALESANCWYGLIADGFHVAPPMLRLALRGAGSPMLVTDAMPPVGGIQTSFTLQGKAIALHDGRCTTKDGVLAGSALDMASAVRNSVRLAGVALSEALTFASLMPARFLGVADRLGRLAPHFRADMVALEPDDIRVTATWVGGEHRATAT